MFANIQMFFFAHVSAKYGIPCAVLKIDLDITCQFFQLVYFQKITTPWSAEDIEFE